LSLTVAYLENFQDPHTDHQWVFNIMAICGHYETSLCGWDTEGDLAPD